MDAGSEMRRLIDLLKDEVSDKPMTTAIDHVDMASALTSDLVRRLKKRLMLKQDKINKAALGKKVGALKKAPTQPKPKVVKSGNKPSSVTTDAPSLPTGNRPMSNSYSAGASFAGQPVAPSSPLSTGGAPPISQ